MITANELRIGNYVWNDKQHLPVKVDISIIQNQIYAEKAITESWKPIPITEEILLKCGFENYQTDKSNVFRLNGFLITYVNEGRFKGKKYLKFHNFTFEDFGHIKHLHTFQNLYFALTGKELEINF